MRKRESADNRQWGSPKVVIGLVLLLVGCAALPDPFGAGDVKVLFNVGTGNQLLAQNLAVFGEETLPIEAPAKFGRHAPTLTAFPDGELLAAWYAYRGPHELDGAAIHMARRLPGQDVWMSSQFVIDRRVAIANPVLYSEDDRVYLFSSVVPGGWSTAHIEMQVSEDRGQTWSSPTRLPGPLGAATRFAPIRTADAGLLLPAYDDLFQRALFYASADGRTWTLRSTFATPAPHNAIQPSVARLGDSGLLAVMRNTGAGWLWVTASDDDGQTWSPAIDGGFPNPASPAALLRLISRRLVLVFNDSPELRRPLSIAISADDGRTWPHRRTLADGEGTFSYPSVVQTADSLIHIVFSASREQIHHATINEAWIVE